jgi:hypothetical protein
VPRLGSRVKSIDNCLELSHLAARRQHGLRTQLAGYHIDSHADKHADKHADRPGDQATRVSRTAKVVCYTTLRIATVAHHAELPRSNASRLTIPSSIMAIRVYAVSNSAYNASTPQENRAHESGELNV